MKPTQIYRDREREFREWLQQRGSEVLPCKGKYEILRFTAPQGVAIIFCKEDGRASYANASAQIALKAFQASTAWRAVVAVTRAPVSAAKWDAILERDGPRCLFCDAPGTADNPLTVDHIVPVSCRGPNHLANLAAACNACNQAMGAMSAAEKIRFALKKRMAA